mmetsp:Transcript_70275/g.158921  ORF Transcript_70275/g.158921 Transcript_70275/m.158921 type:complete len:301 (+) Transcript_70275:176-1078(+)
MEARAEVLAKRTALSSWKSRRATVAGVAVRRSAPAQGRCFRADRNQSCSQSRPMEASRRSRHSMSSSAVDASRRSRRHAAARGPVHSIWPPLGPGWIWKLAAAWTPLVAAVPHPSCFGASSWAPLGSRSCRVSTASRNPASSDSSISKAGVNSAASSGTESPPAPTPPTPPLGTLAAEKPRARPPPPPGTAPGRGWAWQARPRRGAPFRSTLLRGRGPVRGSGAPGPFLWGLRRRGRRLRRPGWWPGSAGLAPFQAGMPWEGTAPPPAGCWEAAASRLLRRGLLRWGRGALAGPWGTRRP